MSEETTAVYVKFGTQPNQKVPLEWAEIMLTALKDSQPQVFGRLLQAAVGVEPKERKPRESTGTGTPAAPPVPVPQPQEQQSGRFGRR